MAGKKRGMVWVVIAIIIIGILIANHLVKENAKQMVNENKQGQKIVVLGDSFVEICLDLGLKAHIVAVSYLGKDIEELKNIKHLGGPQNLSEEELASCKADLIIASDSVELKQRMQTLISDDSVNILFLKHESFEDIITGIKQISEAMGIEEIGNRLSNSITSKININRNLPSDAPKVLMVYSASKGEGKGYKILACIDKDTFLDEILKSAGGVNAIQNSSKRWPNLSIEDLILLNPDIIIDIRPDFVGDTEQVYEEWRNTVPGSTVKAIEKKQVFLMTNHYSLLPSTKIVEVHDQLKKIIDEYQENKQ